MGVEVAEPVNESEIPLCDGKPDIKFGSHGEEAEPVKVEKVKVPDSHLPKGAVDEWPEPKQIHSFYVVRLRSLEDQNLKAKLELAEKELQKKNQSRLQIIEKLKAKRAERSQIIVQLKSLGSENKQFKSIIDEKRKEMEPLQQALGKLRSGSTGGRDRGSSGICSSEEELNDVIKSLQYRIQHESIPLSEEKQILREIKQLEGTRERVLANAAERAKIQESLGEKDAIQGQSIGVDLDGVRKEKNVINAKIKLLDEEKIAVEKQIGALEDELTSVTEKRDNTFESIKEMRKQRDEGNSTFYQYRTIVTKARVLAANKDVDALKELLNSEVENFMSLWNSNKSFRDDYEKRVLPSLDSRQLTRDGRMRNPDEKPLIKPEKPQTDPSESEVVIKGGKKQVLEEVNPVPSPQKPKAAPTDKSKKEPVKNTEKANKKTESVEEEEGFYVETTRKDLLPKKEDEVDEKKLIKMKREEEIAKRKQAEERKRKLAAKAAIRAQKEAEKKLKEREKKMRKKAGATTASTKEDDEVPKDEATEEISNVEAEKITEEKVETSTQLRTRDKKESGGIKRRGRARGNDSLPKAILKRKKTTNYWVWAGASAALALVVVLLVVGYYYVS